MLREARADIEKDGEICKLGLKDIGPVAAGFVASLAQKTGENTAAHRLAGRKASGIPA
jgi:hypothetical protein